MLKALFSSDNHHGIPMLAAANLSLGAVRHWFESAQSIFDAFVPLGQVAVAVVTVFYIFRKTQLLKRHRKHPKK